MTARPADFLVVGGGPAGCAFAILAARAGASVTLVERDDYRRDRPGEHLAGRVRVLLDGLDVPASHAVGVAAPSAGIVALWAAHASPLLKSYHAMGQSPALSVERRSFDAMLFRAAADAGVAAVSAVAAGDAERAPSGRWTLTTRTQAGRTARLHAGAVVDASGRRAVIARRQGARSVHHGDLTAIVRWLEANDADSLPGEALTIESCGCGWWSLSPVGPRRLVATLYTTAELLRASGATPEEWWAYALTTTRRTREVVSSASPSGGTRVFPAYPARLSSATGERWIAVGEAAVALDPICGQGVAYAIDTAFRAFEAARVDPSFASLGPLYSDALRDKFEAHLAGRAEVYVEAGGVLPEAFMRSAVTAQTA